MIAAALANLPDYVAAYHRLCFQSATWLWGCW